MEALAGEYIRNYLRVKRFPRISLVCKLVPVQYREYEYGLLSVFFEQDVVKGYMRTEEVVLPEPERPITEANDVPEENAEADPSELETSIPLVASSEKKEVV